MKKNETTQPFRAGDSGVSGQELPSYEAPEMIVLGSVEELTAGLNGEVGPSQTTTTAT
jgi:hypothetical protein